MSSRDAASRIEGPVMGVTKRGMYGSLALPKRPARIPSQQRRSARGLYRNRYRLPSAGEDQQHLDVVLAGILVMNPVLCVG